MVDPSTLQDINSLLPELLSRVFVFLHIEDKKSVRLVCKKWNECCTCPAIVKNEKFSFRGGYAIESIDVFLQNCVQLRTTIEFQGLPLDQLPSENTWRMIGEKVHSLSLTECEVSSATTMNIFLYCQNMYSYKLYNQSQCSPNITDLFCSPEMLDELIRLNIERRTMTTFKLFIGGIEIAKDILQKIFKIFPCIQSFGTGYSSYTGYLFGSSCIGGSLTNTFDPSLIKELLFNVPSTGVWLQEFANVPQLKLRKLETILTGPECVPRNVFIKFLRNQSELKNLKIALKGLNEDYAKMVLFESLSVCSTLVDFRFKSEVNLKMDEFFQTLRIISVSKLECFMLWFKLTEGPDDKVLADKLSASLTNSMNKTLNILKLETPLSVPIPEPCCLPILKHFSNLRHLELAVASDKVLQTIFQCHIHLRTLVLRKLENCTAFGFTGRDLDFPVQKDVTYSISRLYELTHLELEGFLPESSIENTIREFNFPRLKYLQLSLWGLEEEMTFDCLPTAVPSIEILVLYEIPLKGNQLLYFCTHLRRLKLVLNTWLGQEKTIEELFSVRPSLKYVVDFTDNAYFYDRFTKALRIVNFRDLQFEKSVFCEFM